LAGRRLPAIFRRGDHRFAVELPLPRSDGPARRRRPLYGRSEAELIASWNEAVTALAHGLEPLDRRSPLADVLDRYLTAREPAFTAAGESAIRTSTWKGYEAHCRLHIAPFLGRVPIGELTTRRVKGWLGELEAAGRSTAMRGKVLVSLRTILAWAAGEGYLDENPAAGARPPRHRPREIAPFSLGEIEGILAAVRGHRLEALMLLALTMGPRLGELMGLWLEDLDVERRAIAVGHTLSWATGRAVREEDPKTPRSRRTIALPDTVWAVLERYLAARAAERAAARAAGRPYADTPYLFVRATGGPLRGDGTGGVGDQFKRCLGRAGLPVRNFHQTRHIAASILLSLNGNNIHEVQQILGHSTYRMTLDLYSHLLPEVQAGRAADVDRLLRTLEVERLAREARRRAGLDAAAEDDGRPALLSDLLSTAATDPVAQHESGPRASDCGSEGYGFKPRRPPHLLAAPRQARGRSSRGRKAPLVRVPRATSAQDDTNGRGSFPPRSGRRGGRPSRGRASWLARCVRSDAGTRQGEGSG